ncbi:hypothetical protein M885DRAFT_436822 [Pelagophyceae sp. CCMP2097]|nr:hypothetical protein M885DRAFT_436822 [Pelagophyceae sp. CCMP2097]
MATAFELPALSAAAGFYAQRMRSNPIATKSLTAAIIFGASDATAQKIEASSDLRRTAVTSAIGGIYFAPAAHFWYDWITTAIPGSTLPRILAKALLGQLIFGPLVTCVFFAAAAAQSPEGIRSFPAKLKTDFLSVQLSGMGFWPFVDLVSFSCVPVPYIALFINAASFVWTIFLSLKASRKGKSQEK